ncbi:MAG: FSR family fosmidomycin resistance protein-like MFS transporter [Hyphomicrobiaceae bacterium]|jgi:FSR family fosmidomycin resistance protein-like MFS transporter
MTQLSGQKLASEQKQALTAMIFSNVGHSFSHMFTVLYATAVLYLPKVFDMPYGELLGLSSLGLVLFGVAALPAGWLGDRWSQIGMMVIFFIGIGAGSIVVGIAEGRQGLFIGLTLIGLFASIYHPVGIAWVVAWAKKQGMSLGINGLFGNMGSAVAPVFVGLMIDYVTWRAAFIIPGVLSIAVGCGLLFVWRAGWIRDVTSDRAPSGAHDTSAFVRVFIVLTITMACTGFVYSGLTNTMPKVMEMGLSAALASSYTEIGMFVGVVSGLASFSSIFGGWMADRYSARSIYIVFWLLQIPLLFLIVSLSDATLLVAILLVLSFMLAFAAAENMLVARYTPFRWRSLAYGAKFVLALGIGGLTVHLAGWLFDRDGDFSFLFTMFGSAAILAAAAAFLLPKTQPAVAVEAPVENMAA